MTESSPIQTEAVPLPDVLGTCDCRFKPRMHRTDCEVAIAFDKVPLHERPEYELNKRFAAISWEFPIRLTGEFRIDVALDPFAIIRDRVEQYRGFEMEPGYAEWEKPIQFLCSLIQDQYDVGGAWFGERRWSRDSSYLDELREDSWTPEDYERLEAMLAALPDPNQGALPV